MTRTTFYEFIEYSSVNISVCISGIIDGRWQPNPALSEVGKYPRNYFLNWKFDDFPNMLLTTTVKIWNSHTINNAIKHSQHSVITNDSNGERERTIHYNKEQNLAMCINVPTYTPANWSRNVADSFVAKDTTLNYARFDRTECGSHIYFDKLHSQIIHKHNHPTLLSKRTNWHLRGLFKKYREFFTSAGYAYSIFDFLWRNVGTLIPHLCGQVRPFWMFS